VMMTAWSGPPGRCRCGYWPSGPELVMIPV
jgi:hypothetical protein